jgi:formiminoglutamase
VPATAAYLASLTFSREGEARLGEHVCTVASLDELARCPAPLVLLGIPEDIGVRANFGIGGAHTLWEPALRALLNTQETDACSGSCVVVLGAFDFQEWMADSENLDALQLRSLVERIDAAVYPLIEAVVRAGKIPLVVGGGHNNAYPLLRGASSALGLPLNAINLDAHSDYRRIEGRHSGNPFRYARQQGFLDRYAMTGLHEAYNSSAILQEMAADPALHFSLFEEIFLEEMTSFDEAVDAAVRHTQGKAAGIELDLDCIGRVLTSAVTPCGLSPVQARQYLRQCMKRAQPAYVHIAEGAVRLRDGRQDISTAKLVAYLLRDVIASLK